MELHFIYIADYYTHNRYLSFIWLKTHLCDWKAKYQLVDYIYNFQHYYCFQPCFWVKWREPRKIRTYVERRHGNLKYFLEQHLCIKSLFSSRIVTLKVIKLIFWMFFRKLSYPVIQLQHLLYHFLLHLLHHFPQHFYIIIVYYRSS